MKQATSYLVQLANSLGREIKVIDEDAMSTSIIIPKAESLDIVGPVNFKRSITFNDDITFKNDVRFDGSVTFGGDATFNFLRANKIETLEEPSHIKITPDNNESVQEFVDEEKKINSFTIGPDVTEKFNNISILENNLPNDGFKFSNNVLFYQNDTTDIKDLKNSFLMIDTSIVDKYCIYHIVFTINNGETYIYYKFYFKPTSKVPFKILQQESINDNDNKISIKEEDRNLKINYSLERNINNISIRAYYSTM
ncbi:Hypothetical protein MseVgp033 [Melanoplus sanguinipes entomopoxvirus]|uniref:Uncharacterized protein n=1 Tax=Melanoplus sanguinipes entomopoxvirus TaxID=83191 RepID=Q9YW59_MSEPV|nr:Hypothetical protein MseVgp033 [Melanoplus sanguinipes entomopoxvirus]AAC97615.1 ORF MSV032 hypothetical protein [Melanoplus sanguinipes entomopoxvirus 'O']